MDKSLIDYEYQILGAYATNQDLFEGCRHLVSTNIFSTNATKYGYSIIKNLHDQGITAEPKTIYNELIKAGLQQSEAASCVRWVSSYPSQKDVLYYVTTLFSDSVAKHLAPKLQNAYSKLTSNSLDAIDVMEEIKHSITQIELVLNDVSHEKKVTDIFDATLQRILDLKNNVIEQNGFTFGLKELDARTGGINQGVNVVAATPGGGKSSLLVNIILHNAIDNNVPVLFFSLEMPGIEVMTNIIANYAEINSRALRQGSVDEMDIGKIETMRQRLKDNFVIDDTGGVTWQYIEAKVRAFRKQNKIPLSQSVLVLIDYLQLMNNSLDEKRLTTEERIEVRCNEIARMSKNLNMATVLLSQFSRMEKDRKVPRPKMSDLKGSGAIEACAILILLLFRPEYHDIFTDEKGRDLRGLCEINPVKGRYIKPEPVYARFEGKYSRFSDYIPPENAIKTDNEPPAF